MPIKNPRGDALPPGSVGPRKVPSLPATKWAVPPIQVRRWVRNGTHPNAELENLKAESLNQAGLFRTKDYASFVGPAGLQALPVSADTDLWRFSFRTSQLAHAMMVNVVMNAPSPSYLAANSHAELKLFSAVDESVLVTSETFYYGPAPAIGAFTYGWQYVRSFDKMIEVSPNQDYYALVRRMQGAHIYSVCAFELTSFTEHLDGYLPQNVGVHQPIVDTYREQQVELLKKHWEDGAPKVFNWSAFPGSWSSGSGAGADFDWKRTSSTTGTNILDLTSTAVSANTPGWHPDMRNKKRSSQSGVPCTMRAFGRWQPGAHPDPTGGTVELKDSTGAVVAAITAAWTATPEWKEVSFNIPATHAKYDAHFRTKLGTQFDLWAVSIFEDG